MESLPAVLTADLERPASLDMLCSQARCVVSTAGPFAKLGTPIVEACLRNRTHYADITGEFHWVSEMSERFHAEAEALGIRLVFCCGVDSLPADLCTTLCKQYAPPSSLKIAAPERTIPDN